MCKSVWDEETWSYIILNHDRLIFKEFNNGTKLTTSDTCIFLLSYLLLRSPFRVFNLTNYFLLFFLWILRIEIGDRSRDILPQCKNFKVMVTIWANTFIWKSFEILGSLVTLGSLEILVRSKGNQHLVCKCFLRKVNLYLY